MLFKQKRVIKTYSMTPKTIETLRVNANRLGTSSSALLQHLIEEYAHKVKGE